MRNSTTRPFGSHLLSPRRRCAASSSDSRHTRPGTRDLRADTLPEHPQSTRRFTAHPWGVSAQLWARDDHHVLLASGRSHRPRRRSKVSSITRVSGISAPGPAVDLIVAPLTRHRSPSCANRYTAVGRHCYQLHPEPRLDAHPIWHLATDEPTPNIRCSPESSPRSPTSTAPCNTNPCGAGSAGPHPNRPTPTPGGTPTSPADRLAAPSRGHHTVPAFAPSRTTQHTARTDWSIPMAEYTEFWEQWVGSTARPSQNTAAPAPGSPNATDATGSPAPTNLNEQEGHHRDPDNAPAESCRRAATTAAHTGSAAPPKAASCSSTTSSGAAGSLPPRPPPRWPTVTEHRGPATSSPGVAGPLFLPARLF